MTDLRDTLAVLATVKDGPSDPAGVLALKEKRLGLAILEAEDLAVATDVQLTLLTPKKDKISTREIQSKALCAQIFQAFVGTCQEGMW